MRPSEITPSSVMFSRPFAWLAQSAWFLGDCYSAGHVGLTYYLHAHSKPLCSCQQLTLLCVLTIACVSHAVFMLGSN